MKKGDIEKGRRYGTIQEYFDGEKEVYVLNCTRPLGIISIAFGERMDKHFTIPKTTKPVCITDRVPKKYIEESQSFRNLVSSNRIRLLTKAEYDEAIAVPGVREAVEAQVEELEKKAVELPPKEEGIPTEAPQVNPRVLQLVHMLDMPKGSDQEGVKPSVSSVLEELETMDLSDIDCGYLMSNSTGKLKKWATAYYQDRFAAS